VRDEYNIYTFTHFLGAALESLAGDCLFQQIRRNKSWN